MKQNKQLLKSIEQLIKSNGKSPTVGKTLSSKQLEALRKGRAVLAKSKVTKGSSLFNKLIDLSNLLTGVFSIIKLFKSGIIRGLALLALFYYKIKSDKVI